MTDSEKRARLNEIGKEIAEMFPHSNGSVAFDYSYGILKGVRTDTKWRLTRKEDYHSMRM